MTVLSHAISARAALKPLVRIVAAIGTGIAKVIAFYRNRRTMVQLSELDAHMLADIGLTRSDLRDATAVGPGHDPVSLLSLRRQERHVPHRGLRHVEAPSIADAGPARWRGKASAQPC